MAIFETLHNDLKTSMKAGDKARVEVLRFALAGLQAAAKEKGGAAADASLTDDEVVAILKKDIKRRKDAIVLFKQGGRNDLIEKEEADLVILASYLPQDAKELSEEELGAIVDSVLAQGIKDFGAVMKETMKLAKGRADGKTAGEVIKRKLAA